MGWLAYYAIVREMGEEEAKKNPVQGDKQKTRGEIEYEKALAQIAARKGSASKLGKL